MSDPSQVVDLSKRVHDLVSEYVYRKSEAKSGIKYESFKDKREKDPVTGKERLAVPKDYREAREKVCTDAFLRLRSCRSREDFASYFTGTICSIPQYLPSEEYERISLSLLDDEHWEDVKNLAMLALSALSRT
jgi:CRISPR-associated protein Cmx8